MRRYVIPRPALLFLLALIALLAVMAGSLVMIVSTSPSASAATTHRANVGPLEAFWAVEPNCGTTKCAAWARSTSGVYFNSENVDNFIKFDIGGNGNGYQELIDQAGGCLGWNNDLAEIVNQSCTGATWQLWAGTVDANGLHLIWNKWYDTMFHQNCSVPGGYTQSVISAYLTGFPAGDLELYCPQQNATQYALDQKWVLGAV